MYNLKPSLTLQLSQEPAIIHAAFGFFFCLQNTYVLARPATSSFPDADSPSLKPSVRRWAYPGNVWASKGTVVLSGSSPPLVMCARPTKFHSLYGSPSFIATWISPLGCGDTAAVRHSTRKRYVCNASQSEQQDG